MGRNVSGKMETLNERNHKDEQKDVLGACVFNAVFLWDRQLHGVHSLGKSWRWALVWKPWKQKLFYSSDAFPKLAQYEHTREEPSSRQSSSAIGRFF